MFYTNYKQYKAIVKVKDMIAENIGEFTPLDVEYTGKSGVWHEAVVNIKSNSIVEKVAILAVLSSGSLVNGYWSMPRTEDCCRKYKAIRKKLNNGNRPEFHEEYDKDWDEEYEVVSI